MPFQAQGSTQQLSCSPATLTFGGVTVGQSETQVITLTNNGQSSVTVSAINSGSSVYQVTGLQLPTILPAGQSVAANVVFTPTADGWISANVTFTSNASDPSLKLTVQGNGEATQPLTASPSNLSFGQVSVGKTVTLPVVLTNSRHWQIMVTGLQASGLGFSVSGPGMPVKLGSGQKMTLNVSFDPKLTGEVGGSVFVTGADLSIPLTGTGTSGGQLTESPTALNFGNVDVGNPLTRQFTITASGGPVTISSATSNNSLFVISGVSLPLTLNPSQSAQVYVTFAPLTSGSDSGTVTLTSNASNKQELESVSGTGILSTYSVDVSWTASTSQVAGYNVYRGTLPGSYSKINSVLDTSLTYTDNSVASGMTYYYAATSVTSTGEESGYSSPVEVSIP